jgi:hypothetical protein
LWRRVSPRLPSTHTPTELEVRCATGRFSYFDSTIVKTNFLLLLVHRVCLNDRFDLFFNSLVAHLIESVLKYQKVIVTLAYLLRYEL